MTGEQLSDAYGAASQVLGEISDDELRMGVGRLFAEAQRLVHESGVDVVVIAARRLACLYQLLVRAGMPQLSECLVVSNRVLDAAPQWGGKRVLILDDSVVVGTTLTALHDRIAAQVGENGSVLCRSVCVDVDQRANFLLDGLPFSALLERGSEDVKQFSTEIVKELFDHQVPFFSDYPTTRPILFDVESWTGYLGGPDWHIADVTAPLLDSSRHDALAQIPSRELLDGFLTRLAPQVASLIDAVKVRLYAERLEDCVRTVVVPIALISPCRVSALDDALSAICEVAGGEAATSLNWRQWRPEAKHRLLQLYVSACVLAEAWPSLAAAGGLQRDAPKADDLEPLQVQLYFGAATQAILDAFDSVVLSYLQTSAFTYEQPVPIAIDQPPSSPLLAREGMREILWDARELVAEHVPDEPEPGELTKLGLVFAHGVTSLFGYINRTYEAEQRKEILSFRSREEYDAQYSDPNQRLLRQGFTMRELTASLMPESIGGSPWSRCLVSLGIDAGNDLGIIVPSTRYCEDRDIVYRCYRLGETAHLADRPLIATAQEDFDLRDEITRCAESGFPVSSFTLPIEAFVAKEGVEQHRGSLALLELAVQRAAPGRIESRFEGTVTGLHEEHFDADLTTPNGTTTHTAHLSMSQVREQDRNRLGVGSRFSWLMLVHDLTDGRERTSRIRVRAWPPLDAKSLEAGVARIRGRLFSDDEQSAAT